MGLGEMLSKIKEETEEQYTKIIADAKTEADRIVSSAMERSESIISKSKVQAEKEVQEERLRSIASARLEAKRQLLQARDKVIRDYEAQSLGYVDEFVKSKDYKDFLLRVIEDGMNKIGDKAIVQLNSKDKNLIPTSKSGFNISEKTLESRGGALISSSDGKQRVDNTIESILSERSEELRLKLLQQIFGNGKIESIG
jgi:V/A-type H+-transporting ATPase subunit E